MSDHPGNTEEREDAPQGDPAMEADLKRDFENEVWGLSRDSTLSRKQQSEKKKALLARQAVVEKERERRAVAALRARLPRPDWYSSDDDDDAQSAQSEPEVKEVSDLTLQPEGRAGLIAPIRYTVLSAVAFIFHLVSTCPVPWLRGKDGRQYGVWRATGGGEPAQAVKSISDCSYEQQYWQAAAAMSVFATLASLGALVSGVLLCVRKGHMGASFILSFFGMSFGLTAWALVVALFHYFRCGKGVFANGLAHLDAGFALTLIGWVCNIAAILILAIHFFTYWTRSIHGGSTRGIRYVYVVISVITILFYCVALAFTMWGKTFTDVKVSVTLWNVEVYDRATHLSTFLNRLAYQCTTITRRMKVVAAFMIMSLTWLFFAVVFGTAACHNSSQVKISLIFGYASCIFALVAWVLILVIFNGTLCTSETPSGVSYWVDKNYNGIPSGILNAKISFGGYTLREGFGLIVAGWALQTIFLIFSTVLYGT